jgi:hypothetical protein
MKKTKNSGLEHNRSYNGYNTRLLEDEQSIPPPPIESYVPSSPRPLHAMLH